MVRYPYQLWAQRPQEAQQDAKGNPIPVFTDFEPVSDCRDQVNAGGKMIALADGTMYAFTGVLHLPLPAPDLAVGMVVEVRDGELVRQSGSIKRVHAGLLHVRVWL